MVEIDPEHMRQGKNTAILRAEKYILSYTASDAES